MTCVAVCDERLHVVAHSLGHVHDVRHCLDLRLQLIDEHAENLTTRGLWIQFISEERRATDVHRP
jgi:hypothetical protein